MPARLFLHHSLSQLGLSRAECQEHATFGCLDFPATPCALVLCKDRLLELTIRTTGSRTQSLLQDLAHRSLWCITVLSDTYNMKGLLPVTDLRTELGEGVGEQTNLYKLQSYSIYKAQTEPEPWGTQDGNNLQSRFAWSYAAFETTDSAGGAGRGTGRDAGLHLCGRYHHRFPYHPALFSALHRVKFIAERSGIKVFLVLSTPNSREGAFGGVWAFVPLRLGTFIPSPVINQVIPLFLPISQHIWVGKGVKGWWGV